MLPRAARNVAPLDQPRRRLKRWFRATALRTAVCAGRYPWQQTAATAQERPARAASRWSAHFRAARPRCSKRSSPAPESIQRQGTVEAGNTVGDASKEARHHRMSVELTVATTTFMGDSYTFLDCPGSVEFVHDMRAVLPAIDAAVVVCEMDEKKSRSCSSFCASWKTRKFRAFCSSTRSTRPMPASTTCFNLLQPASRTKLFLRQIPTFDDDIINGFVDLALERAFVYKEHAPSEVFALEGEAPICEKDARFTMLETLADHDDELMEQLLADVQPPRDKVFDDLDAELREGLVCPVLMGVADARQRRFAPA